MSADMAGMWAASLKLKREITGQPGVSLDVSDQSAILAATVGRWAPRPVVPGSLTVRTAMELICHEAIVREAYKDSRGIWTWSVGITNASGHHVDRYKDHPQPIERCLEVFLWVLRERYIPSVLRAFESCPLSEEQFAAALSFHHNTGAIGKADWVYQWLNGEKDMARVSFMSWRRPAEIIPRREKERDLFFDGKWSGDGMATVYPVRKPSYQPDFRNPQQMDVRPALAELLS